MPAAYVPLLFLAVLVLSLPVITLTILKITRTDSPGVPPKSQPDGATTLVEDVAGPRDFARFYIIAVLFVIFSVVTIFLYPWAMMFRAWLAAQLAAFALLSMLAFLGILVVGYIWLYKKRSA